jgi:hypothetical protein
MESIWQDVIFDSEIGYKDPYLTNKCSYRGMSINEQIWHRNYNCRSSLTNNKQNLNIENKEEENMTKLYKATVAGTEQYVTLIGRDGADYVVKVSDTGKIVAVKEIIEVMPDTVGIRFNSAIGGGPSSRTYHFIVDDLTKFAVGDVIIPSGSNDMATIVEVDNKSPRACKKLTGRRVMTEAI